MTFQLQMQQLLSNGRPDLGGNYSIGSEVKLLLHKLNRSNVQVLGTLQITLSATLRRELEAKK